MHARLAEKALAIVSNDPTCGTESDITTLREFCKEFQDGLARHDHPVKHAVRGVLHDMGRSKMQTENSLKEAVHAMCSVELILRATEDVLCWIETCMRRILYELHSHRPTAMS